MKKRLSSVIGRIRLFRNWYRFTYPFNVKRYNVTAVLRSGARFLLRDIRSDDYSTLVSIAGGDSYCLSAIHSPRVILDVGAHIGFFSVLAAIRFPDAKVIAVEPDGENYAMLLRNIALNGLTNVSAQNIAVAGGYGTVSLYKSTHTVAHSLFFDFDGKSLEKVEANAVPLSHFRDIDVLKFDAEGAEYFVKEFPTVSYFAIELHKVSGQDMNPLIETIESRYRIIKKETEKTGHVNIVAVKREKST